jgi:hypothetical protein
MLAHAQGSPLNQARLAASLGVSSPAVGRYVDLLADLRLLRRLVPWSGNVGKRLVKAAKIYIRDSGLVHALLELETRDQVLGHPVAGHSYEGMVVETLIAAAGDRRQPFFFRTQDGAEIDLVFERGGRPELAIEIKRSTAPTVGRGFSTACNALGVDARFVVHPGSERFPLRGGVEAVPLDAAANYLRE